MALNTRTASIDTRPMVAGAALALALLASLVGGAVGALVTSGAAAPTTADPQKVIVLESKWVDYGRDWERQYRDIYPGSAQ